MIHSDINYHILLAVQSKTVVNHILVRNGVEEELQVKRGDNFLKIIRTLIKKPIDILFGGKRATKTDLNRNYRKKPIRRKHNVKLQRQLQGRGR